MPTYSIDSCNNFQVIRTTLTQKIKRKRTSKYTKPQIKGLNQAQQKGIFRSKNKTLKQQTHTKIQIKSTIRSRTFQDNVTTKKKNAFPHPSYHAKSTPNSAESNLQKKQNKNIIEKETRDEVPRNDVVNQDPMRTD